MKIVSDFNVKVIDEQKRQLGFIAEDASATDQKAILKALNEIGGMLQCIAHLIDERTR
jgi:pyruvate dehydrogenase complex dehydrogenase (E1) component